jgi:hypothetical protein
MNCSRLLHPMAVLPGVCSSHSFRETLPDWRTLRLHLGLPREQSRLG